MRNWRHLAKGFAGFSAQLRAASVSPLTVELKGKESFCRASSRSGKLFFLKVTVSWPCEGREDSRAAPGRWQATGALSVRSAAFW